MCVCKVSILIQLQLCICSFQEQQKFSTYFNFYLSLSGLRCILKEKNHCKQRKFLKGFLSEDEMRGFKITGYRRKLSLSFKPPIVLGICWLSTETSRGKRQQMVAKGSLNQVHQNISRDIIARKTKQNTCHFRCPLSHQIQKPRLS